MDTETSSPDATPTSDAPPTPALAVARQRARDQLERRTRGLPAWVVLIELFIGLGWLRAATEKLIDPAWWQGQQLAQFLAEHRDVGLLWYRPFLDIAVSPHLLVTSAIVVAAQLAAGLCLVVGRHRAAAIAVGIFLNLNFLAAGAVNPSAFYLLAQGAVALWLVERSRRRGVVRRMFVARTGALVLAVASLPLVRTIEPEAVIDDPAAMFVTGGLVTVVAVDVALRNRAERPHRHAGHRSGHDVEATAN